MMSEKVKTLADGLIEELKRNRELLGQYKSIGAPGILGAAMIEQAIRRADKAIIEGDPVAMLQIYETLKENQ